MTHRSLIAAVVLLAAGLGACGSDEGGSATRAPPVAKAVPTTVCSPLTYGGDGKPSLVVALVGPLQNAFSDHGIQNAQAVKLVMQQRGWRAGEHRIAIQVCDESSADAYVDLEKCKRNAAAFAENPSVIAVIGPTLSSCAAAMIPRLNEADGGPVPQVGTGNTYLGLTRAGPGVEEGDPERLYPTGRRNFLRPTPPDDAQAAAAVIVAGQGGARRTFALHDGDTFGKGLAGAFQEAAKRHGLAPVGIERWDAKAAGYRDLAARIRASGADAVYVAGYVTSNGPRLIRDLGAGLGSDVQLLAPDGFNQPTAIVEGAGARADGLVITLAAAPVRALPAEGRRWAGQFESRWGSKPCCYAVVTGQVTQIVLDAIERSDGTRAGVLDSLFSTKVSGGLLGDFSFDRFGDTTLSSIATYRIHGGRVRFERMVEVPQALLTRR
jgi:branched-chain amino acid transport system substrate-binding protein